MGEEVICADADEKEESEISPDGVTEMVGFPLIVGNRRVDEIEGLDDTEFVADSERSGLGDAVGDAFPVSEELLVPSASFAEMDGPGLPVSTDDRVAASRGAVPVTDTDREWLGDEDEEAAGEIVEIDDTDAVLDRDACAVEVAQELDEKEYSGVLDTLALS
jgi:hypothetical protein